MNLSILVLLLTIFTNLSSSEETTPVVKIANGELKGTSLKSRNDRSYSAFMGIPYGKVTKRFHLAENPDAWEESLDASSYGSPCIQTLPYVPNAPVQGTEDCLFINVFSPKTTGNLPVMVFIHGGGFMFGSSNEYGADYFMDEDVVLVTFNYRLGAFGFLSTGDGETEANLGLKDQLLALQWVQKNIKSFGGDADQVTLFGESAGSASVHFHVLSPLTEGLFSKAILQSGSALNPWAYRENPEKNALALGKGLGCDTESSDILVKCLSEANPQDIIKYDLTQWYLDPIVSFGPSPDFPGKSKLVFIPDSPINILKEGKFQKMPMIFTVCQDEGLLFHSVAVNWNEKLRKEMNEDFLRVLPVTLLYKDIGFTSEQQNWISTRIKRFYFGNKEIKKETFQNLTNMYSDRNFFHGVQNALMYHAQHGATVFNAILAHKGEKSHTILTGVKEILGVSHADDLLYLFKLPTFPEAFAEKSSDELASKYIVSAWANFAKTGRPKVNDVKLFSWDPLDVSKAEKNGPTWLQIKMPPTKVENPFKKRIEFWEKVFKKVETIQTLDSHVKIEL